MQSLKDIICCLQINQLYILNAEAKAFSNFHGKYQGKSDDTRNKRSENLTIRNLLKDGNARRLSASSY